MRTGICLAPYIRGDSFFLGEGMAPYFTVWPLKCEHRIGHRICTTVLFPLTVQNSCSCHPSRLQAAGGVWQKTLFSADRSSGSALWLGDSSETVPHGVHGEVRCFFFRGHLP